MSPLASPIGSSLSFIIPVHNEARSLQELYDALVQVCHQQGYRYEVVFVDDGSDDESFSIISAIAERDETVRAVQLRRNFGQTAALRAGVTVSTSPVLVTLDADLQNDPQDVPHLLQKLQDGFDVVSGWRRDRQEGWKRRWPSWWANHLISSVTGVRLSDYGCTLKAYRREVIEGAPLYGEMHRFIPILAAWHGARVAEVPVQHHPRKYGTSHYGMRRVSRVLLDLITVKFLHSYVTRPMHFFGGSALWLIAGGIVSGLMAVVLKVTGLRAFVDTPLPLLSVFLLIVGVQFLLMGLLAELLIRIYFDRSGRHPYAVRRAIRCSPPT